MQVATPEEIYRNPVDVRVAEFIGSPKINLLPARAGAGGRISVCNQPLRISTPDPLVQSVTLGVRPENVELSIRERSDLQGQLVYLENMGAEFIAHVDVPGLETPVLVRCDVEQGHQLKLDQQIGIRIKPKHALLFNDQGRRIESCKLHQEARHEFACE